MNMFVHLVIVGGVEHGDLLYNLAIVSQCSISASIHTVRKMAARFPVDPSRVGVRRAQHCAAAW